MKTVVVIDDFEPFLELMCEALLACGYGVLPYQHAPTALRECARLHPDAILLDINMPHLSGQDLLVRLRALPHLATTPIIVTSAGMIPDEAGADPHTAALPKPFEIAGLDALLREVTEQRMLQAGV